jgi:hypothetical protein
MAEVLEVTVRLVLELVFEVVCHGIGSSVRWLLRWPPPAHPDADYFIGLVVLIVVAIATCTILFGSASACQLTCA